MAKQDRAMKTSTAAHFRSRSSLLCRSGRFVGTWLSSSTAAANGPTG